MQVSIKKILKDRPFKLDIKKISPMAVGDTGESFAVEAATGKFKLRACGSVSKAKKVEITVLRLPSAFPKFYGRDKKYLLFEFIEGRTLTKAEPPGVYFKLGKLCGEIHKIQLSDLHIRSRFKRYLKYCTSHKLDKSHKLLTPDEAERLWLAFETLRKKLRIDFSLDVTDFQPANFMIDKASGGIFMVDEEGVGHAVRGFGLARPLMRWFSPADREAFINGYNSVNDFGFFHADYEKFINIYYFVTRVMKGHEAGKLNPKGFNTLKSIAKTC